MERKNVGSVSLIYSCVEEMSVKPGPAQQDFEWGGSSVSQVFFFFFSGGGGGVWAAEACYPGKIRVLVTLGYRKVDLKLTNSVLKRSVFTT